MTLLRNGRGRIRCYIDECDHWASLTHRAPTAWSLSALVPICNCCWFVEDECEGDGEEA